MSVCAHACMLACVAMDVFPSVEDFQGPRDYVEFMRGSFLSPDSISSCVELPASGPPRRRVGLHLDDDSGSVSWFLCLRSDGGA